MRGATTRRSRAHPGSSRNFNPRSPCGERQGSQQARLAIFRFQPTLPMRGATEIMPTVNPIFVISTHAPHAGSDGSRSIGKTYGLIFQPTLPMRGATLTVYGLSWFGIISTHAPHAGSDLPGFHQRWLSCLFQPTLPMRGATLLRVRPGSVIVFQPTLPMRGATMLL